MCVQVLSCLWNFFWALQPRATLAFSKHPGPLLPVPLHSTRAISLKAESHCKSSFCHPLLAEKSSPFTDESRLSHIQSWLLTNFLCVLKYVCTYEGCLDSSQPFLLYRQWLDFFRIGPVYSVCTYSLFFYCKNNLHFNQRLSEQNY